MSSVTSMRDMFQSPPSTNPSVIGMSLRLPICKHYLGATAFNQDLGLEYFTGNFLEKYVL